MSTQTLLTHRDRAWATSLGRDAGDPGRHPLGRLRRATFVFHVSTSSKQQRLLRELAARRSVAALGVQRTSGSFVVVECPDYEVNVDRVRNAVTRIDPLASEVHAVTTVDDRTSTAPIVLDAVHDDTVVPLFPRRLETLELEEM